jgi:ABC-type transport system substrate-binding protein
MIEGSEKIDFSQASPRVTALDPGRSLHLVRNPSWKPGNDPLRPAYVDRIDMTFTDSSPGLAASATAGGSTDVVLDPRPPSQDLRDLAAAVRNDPARGAVHVGERDFVRYVSMNLATPPFDDVAVRKAVNYAIDKATIETVLGGPYQGRPAGHIALDSLEENLLVSYDPYHTAGDRGDLNLAREQMRRSKYDSNHDGLCDAPVCNDIAGYTGSGIPTLPKAADVIARNLAGIGLHVRVNAIASTQRLFSLLYDPRSKVPLSLTIGVGAPSPISASFFTSLFARAAIGNDLNTSLLGATPAQLRGWGYTVTSVPSVDDRLDECARLAAREQVRCWASLDQYLMEEIVPWAPFSFESTVMVVSPRIVAFSFDQFSNLPALERIALKPGS